VTIEPAHIEHAKAIAEKFLKRLPPSVDADAYRGAALEALVRAAAAFDPEHGQSFNTFASIRMWFAMQDEARQLSPNSRGAIAAARRGERHVIRHRSGRERELPFGVQVPLHAPVREDSEMTLADVIPAPEELESKLVVAELRDRINRLGPRHRFVLLARMRGYTQVEIAELLGVTHCRVSQIESRAVQKVA
jgi:RNA polymerase sigma factor (sigma-70 family)